MRQTSFNTIGRMYSVSPAQTELFHLRILLLSVKRAKSFEDLRTVDGVLHSTFAATCLALGLIESDEKWRKAMIEATSWMMPRQLRYLFVRILIHCQPIYPNELWTEFKNAMAEDYARNYDSIQSEKMAYDHIQQLLQEQSYHDFHVSEMDTMEPIVNNTDVTAPEQYLQKSLDQYSRMNNTQKQIADAILAVLDNNNVNDGKCFFMDGPGGSGKTFIYETLYYLIKGRNKDGVYWNRCYITTRRKNSS